MIEAFLQRCDTRQFWTLRGEWTSARCAATSFPTSGIAALYAHRHHLKDVCVVLHLPDGEEIILPLPRTATPERQ